MGSAGSRGATDAVVLSAAGGVGGGEVLVTRPVVETAGGQDGLRFERIGEVRLKGFSELTELFTAQRAGFVGAQGRREDWTWSSLYEFNIFLDFVALEKMRIRAGWTAMWLLHVAEGFQQVNYDLANQPGRRRDSGRIFYQGPVLEVQFLF